MKTFVHIIQKTGYILACIGMAAMDSKDRLFPICFMALGGLIMYGFTDREAGVSDETGRIQTDESNIRGRFY